MEEARYFYGTGRRKTAIARVRLYPDGKEVTVNEKPLGEYFPGDTLQALVLQPLQATENLGKFKVVVKVVGGGSNGQAEAVRHGIARALLEVKEEYRSVLRQKGFLTRDPREKERKKYGLKRARKARQYRKR